MPQSLSNVLIKIKATSVWCALVMAAFWGSAVALGAHVVEGQQAKDTAEGKEEAQKSAKERQLADMRRIADSIQVTVGVGEGRKKAKLIPKPLFRFSDPARLYSDGSVWAWVTVGRPVIMTEFNTADQNEGIWGHDLVATSDTRISAEIAGHGGWAPREPDFELQPVPDVGVPAKSESGRLRQMKQFARRLDASEMWQGQRYELRLLPTEIYRYSDAESGLVDGAAFVFAFGNNPETILFVEAHQADSGESSWKYGLARMSAAAVTFRLGDTEVWSVPQSFGGRSAAYYIYTRRVPDFVDSQD